MVRFSLAIMYFAFCSRTLNSYIATESTRYNFLADAQFTSGRDEHLPIPQAEINLTHGLYVQNNGW